VQSDQEGRANEDQAQRRWRRSGGSGENSARSIKDAYPGVDVVEVSENRGPIGGMNLILDTLLQRNVDAILLLTHETLLAPDALDADPWLLNVRNGTIELKTGELREHRRDDLITKLASVEYDPEAEDKRWDTFLEQVTDGDDVLAGFLVRAVGCTLVGFASEEAIFFVHGPGATGKTTFVEAVKTALGDYALTTGFDTFLRKRAGGIPVDIARFPGARLVVASEVDEGQRLAEGMVKQLTGGDTVTARHLYSSPFEFKPQMTLWFVANSRPAVVGSDDGFWRRMTQIPFLRVVPEGERNTDFKRQLTLDPAALAAVASWAVRGCLDWQRVGLEVPQKVRDYTADYRTENSPIDRWMSDELAFEPEAITTNGELRASLESWIRANEFKEIPWTAVPKALKKLGCESTKIGGTSRFTRPWISQFDPQRSRASLSPAS
jgi:putative DNA primase/helicase